jgi:hypothetical protein
MKKSLLLLVVGALVGALSMWSWIVYRPFTELSLHASAVADGSVHITWNQTPAGDIGYLEIFDGMLSKRIVLNSKNLGKGEFSYLNPISDHGAVTIQVERGCSVAPIQAFAQWGEAPASTVMQRPTP